MLIQPVQSLGNSLLAVEKPARYVGGEYRIIRKPADTEFRIALSFPDLYEIGMSNYSIRILYTRLNALEDVSCERVFAPAPDFEALLDKNNMPLFSLENGLPLKDFDILAFSVGYELSATSILSILDKGRIPLHSSDRGSDDPIVIAGGSAVTNPAPLSAFLDGVFIGEAEDAWIQLVTELRNKKKAGAGRRDLLEIIHNHPSIWHAGKTAAVRRAVWGDFGCQAFHLHFPLPGLTAVQDHGVIEIMRGCPNGCRFCHAGVVYRPHREKEISEIIDEAEWLYRHYGYREITLSSLSTGDYSRLQPLVETLTARFSSRKVSFSLPSLRVNSFTLPILNRISEVRKSGLTFAIETPGLFEQQGLNKEVPAERIIDILNTAKQFGWRSAKFYFMVGLPQDTEETPGKIVDYLESIRKATGVRIHVTVNTFIPKPHTPFQRSFQLSEDEALKRIYAVKNGLNRKLYKFGFHSPFASILEGLISRGDERVGELIEKAYRAGARLDAWEEHLDRDLWRGILDEADWDPAGQTIRPREKDEKLPWDGIDMGVREGYLAREERRSQTAELTDPCETACRHNCGACDDELSVKIAEDFTGPAVATSAVDDNDTVTYRRFFFSFEKLEASRFLSHKNLVGVFQRLFTRLEIPVRYTEGFNPKPKLEFAHPLSLGVSSRNEIAAVFLSEEYDPDLFLEKCNTSLPEGMHFTHAGFIEFPKGIKSIMSYYYGSDYRLLIRNSSPELVKKTEELFTPFIGTAEYPDADTVAYSFFYPDGRNDVKGISRLLRNSVADNFEQFELERLKTYFRPENPNGSPVSLPGSSSGP